MSKKEILDKEEKSSTNNEKKVGDIKKGKKTTQKAKVKSSKTKKLEKEFEELHSELEELRVKYLRQAADFDNFRKRTAKERLDLINTAAEDTIRNLLPVMDDFDRAVKVAETDETTEPMGPGVKLVYQRLKKTFEQLGLKEMESDGENFDPELHDAITEIPAPSEELKGKIVDTIEKGYYLKDKIIRHARVVVGK